MLQVARQASCFSLSSQNRQAGIEENVMQYIVLGTLTLFVIAMWIHETKHKNDEISWIDNN